MSLKRGVDKIDILQCIIKIYHQILLFFSFFLESYKGLSVYKGKTSFDMDGYESRSI